MVLSTIRLLSLFLGDGEKRRNSSEDPSRSLLSVSDTPAPPAGGPRDGNGPLNLLTDVRVNAADEYLHTLPVAL